MNPLKVVIQDFIWAVYSEDVGDEVGTRSGMCHIMCVEHVCTLYTYPISCTVLQYTRIWNL